MRKFLSVLLCALVLLCPLCMSACQKEEARTSYVITGEYFPEEGKMEAETVVTVYNDSDNALSELKFFLYPNAYREGAKHKPVSSVYEASCYYAGESYGKIEITALTGGEMKICGEDENILSVSLAKPLYPDESVKISISYTVTLAKAAHRLGVGKTTVNLTGFYPVLCHLSDNGFEEYVCTGLGDPFVSECADYEISLTVPEELQAVYGGEGESVSQNGKTTYHVINANARDTAFVLYEQCEKLTGESNGVTVEYYYVSDKKPEATLSAAVNAIAYYSKTFSPYERKRYVVAECDLANGGMEQSGLSLISNTLHENERAQVVAHETAHQWWYASVGSNQVTESWQDEGLCEYSTALFLEEFPEYGSSLRECVQEAERAYRTYFSVYSQLGGANTAMSRPLVDYSGEYEYRSIAYDKGLIMFDRVRETVGEKKFFSALEKYAKTYAGKIASRGDLIACFENAGARSEELFCSFLDGKCVI